MRINDYLEKAVLLLRSVDQNNLEEIVELIQKAVLDSKNIFIIGNGGSASLASHFATDLSKRIIDGKEIRAISLCENIPLLTMISNDHSYGEIFSYQLKRHMEPGDLLFAISASGTSENIVNGAKTALELGNSVIGLCGFSGGELREISTASVHLEMNDFGMVESIADVLCHLIVGQFDS